MEQLDGIYAYIAKDSPRYAQRVVDRIIERAESLILFPRGSAVVPEFAREDVREVFVFHYRIIYVILDERIDILAVLHGSKELPSQL